MRPQAWAAVTTRPPHLGAHPVPVLSQERFFPGRVCALGAVLTAALCRLAGRGPRLAPHPRQLAAPCTGSGFPRGPRGPARDGFCFRASSAFAVESAMGPHPPLPVPLPSGSAVGRNARVPIVLENVCSRVTGAAILPPSRSLWFVWTAGLLATLWSTLQLAMCLGRVPETACPGRIWVRASHGGSPGAGPHCDSIP